MPSCSVYGCLHTSSSNPELAFFKFPVDVERRTTWLRLISREDLMEKNPVCYVVCQAHFNKQCIIITSNRKLLKKNAVPSLYLPKTVKASQYTTDNDDTMTDAFTQTDYLFSGNTGIDQNAMQHLEKTHQNQEVECIYDVSDIRACRICLNTDVRLYKYDRYNLKQCYEEVMAGKVFNIKDGLPIYFCYECAMMLHKFHKFRKKCCTGDKLLNEMRWTKAITLEEIVSTDREFHKLNSPLDIFITDPMFITCVVKNEPLSDHITEEMDEIDIPDIPKLEPIDGYNEINVEDTMIQVNTFEGRKITEVNILDRPDILESNIINEQKLTSLNMFNVAKKDVVSDEEHINIDADLMNNDKESNAEIHNTLTAKDEQVIKGMVLKNYKRCKKEKHIDVKDNKVVKKKATVRSIGDKESLVAEKGIVGEKKGRVGEIVDRYGIIKKNRGGRRKKMQVEDKNELDPKYWLTFHLSEEEAKAEFEARAKDAKFLKAAHQCSDCYRGFSQKDMLVRHNKLMHAESKGQIVCRFCKMRFKWNCHLTRHIVQHYTRFKCLRCDLVSPLLMGAILHNDYHNGVTKRCPHCGEEFKHKSTYYTHLRMSHRSEHVCTLCGASFVSAMGLKQHRHIKHVAGNIVSEEVNLHCERCDVTFETRVAYEAHMYNSAKHEEAIEDGKPVPAPKMRRPGAGRTTRRPRESVTCTICGKCFVTYPMLVRHHRAQHPNAALPHKSHLQPPRHKYADRQICEICGISISYGNMGTHLNRHTRERHYDCRSCGRQFNSRTGLNNHQASHSSERRVSCPLCEKRFKQRVSMKLHYRTAHLKQPYPKRNRNKKKEEEAKLTENVLSSAEGAPDSLNSKYFFH